MLILCDGGCDVLLTGAESGLATPVEVTGQPRGTFFCLVPFGSLM